MKCLFFSGKTYTLKQGGTLNLAAQKSDNYTVASVYRADENGNKTGNALSLRQDGKIAESLSENTNYCVFYQATTDNDFRGNVTFYDYQINPPAGQKSINDPSYYGKADNNRRFAMGNSGYIKLTLFIIFIDIYIVLSVNVIFVYRIFFSRL